MKHFNFFKPILLLVCLLLITPIFGNNIQDVELKKQYSKEFPTDASTTLEISNTYGKVEVMTWTKSAIKVDVTVIVKGKNKSTAEDRMNDIDVRINKSGNSVIGITNIESSKSSGWMSWFSSGSNTNIEINYVIHMPEATKSIIENKYGNIYLPSLLGQTNINLKYGNLQGKDINNRMTLDLSYGKATMGKVGDLTCVLAYSGYKGTSVANCNLTTKYSNVYFDNATSIKADSKYDDYKLGIVNSLNITGSYNDISVQNVNNAVLSQKYTNNNISFLGSTLTADIGYGSLTIENLKTTFKSIDVNTSYAPVRIYGVVPTKVTVDGKYCDVKLGADFIEKSKDIQGSSKNISGYKINDKTQASIKIVSRYGDVIIR